MTKKDYIAIAEAFSRNKDGSVADVAQALCAVFKADNRLFDRNRFLEACGLVNE